jgi:hypothetical protein
MSGSAAPRRVTCFVLALLLLAPLSTAFPPETPPPECFEDEEVFPGADVLFVLDLTGSMGSVLASAKAEATAIMGDLAAELGDIRFGAASHMDYPGTFSYPGYSSAYGYAGDYPWRLDQDLTTDTAAVQSAIDGLALGSGADGPESYVTAMYEATESVSWGAPRVKAIVFFADNVPHDLEWNGRNTGGEPGRDGIAMTADDLDWQTVVAGVAAAGIRVVGIDSGGASEMMGYLASETGGNWTRLGSGSAFRQTVVDMVLGVVGGPAPVDETPPTLAFTSPASARLYHENVDIGASPFPETALVASDLPFALAAADDCKLRRVDVHDGAALVASWTDFPLEGVFLGSAAAPGLHVLTAIGYDWVGHSATAVLPVRVLAVDQRADAQGLFVATNAPATVEVGTGRATAAGSPDAQDTRYGSRVVPTALGDARYETMHANAQSWLDDAGTSHAVATSVMTGVELLDGRIRAEALRAVSSAEQTLPGAVTLDTAGTSIAGLVIDGTPYPAPVPGQEVPLPGLGYVRLFEVDAPSPSRAVQQVNALHVFVETPTLKGEIILGSAFAAAGFLEPGDRPRRAILAEDDAGTDADAGASLAGAPPIAPGIHSGAVWRDDAADVYSFSAGEGDRIVLALAPAARLDVALVREPTVDPLDDGATLTPALASDVFLDLLDPRGVVRDRTAIAAGDRIEFNADVDGTWYARVDGSLAAERRNYTLAFERAPLVFLPGDDLDGDAPGTCAGARLVEKGPHAGVLRGGDLQDAYAFPVALGEIVTVTLKPDELDDGANFDLLLYDPDCDLLAWSALGEPNDGPIPKGSPDFTVALPAERTGLYRAIVVRVDGVGNYYLDVESTNPMPTLPGNDAGSGRDTTGPGDAIVLASSRARPARRCASSCSPAR